MREEIMQSLAEALGNNIGSKLTPELATGIATRINQHWLERESSVDSANTPTQPV